MVTPEDVLDSATKLDRAIGRAMKESGHPIERCEAVTEWSDRVKAELTGRHETGQSGYPSLAECDHPELLLSTVQWRAGSSGWQYLLPVMASWGYFWWVEHEFKASESPLSLFAWWTKDGGPLGLGPAGLSLIILLAVVYVAVSVSRSARLARKRAEARSALTSALLRLCTIGKLYRAQKLDSRPTPLTAAVTRLGAVLDTAAVVKPSDVVALKAASQMLSGAVNAMDSRIARMAGLETDIVKALDHLTEFSAALATNSSALTQTLNSVKAVAPAAREMATSAKEVSQLNTALRTNVEQFSSSWAAALKMWRQEVMATGLQARDIDAAAEDQKALRTATAELAGQLGTAVERALQLQRESRDLLERSLIMLSMADAADEQGTAS